MAAAGVASAAGSAAKSAGRAGPAAAVPLSPVPSARSQLKPQIVEVSRATLRQHVEAELNQPRASGPPKVTSAQLRGCIHLLAGHAPLVLVESVQFEGQPATIIVARTGQDYTAWVAGLDCSATSSDVLHSITLP